MTLTAGPELDKKVAEAVGDPYPRAHNWEWTGLSGYVTSFYRCVNCGDLDATDCTEPEPKGPCVRPYSTDLNVAFAAAEGMGLFNHYRVLRTNRYHWEVMEIGDPVDRIVSKGDTPALAICAAILKLREKE